MFCVKFDRIRIQLLTNDRSERIRWTVFVAVSMRRVKIVCVWVQGAGDGGDAGQAQVPVCPDGGGQEGHRLLTHQQLLLIRCC